MTVTMLLVKHGGGLVPASPDHHDLADLIV